MYNLKKFPLHGGDLRDAQRLAPNVTGRWLDLSTGISPWLPVLPDIPTLCWQHLTQQHELHILKHSAALYYACPEDFVVPLPGTQAFVFHLPHVLPARRVALPCPGYKSYARAWQDRAEELVFYRNFAELCELNSRQPFDLIIAINPSNPTAEFIYQHELLALIKTLTPQQTLLVDEAFIDVEYRQSLASVLENIQHRRVLILRSLGKFFGLPGARLGFVICHPGFQHQLSIRDIFSWLPNPSVLVALKILADSHWQDQQRERIRQMSQAMEDTLQQLYPTIKVANAGLFLTLMDHQAKLTKVFDELLQQGIYTRLGIEDFVDDSHDQPAWLRIGLPKDLAEFTSKIKNINGVGC